MDNIKRSMHWDDDTLVGHQIEIENTNWSAITPEGKPDYPTFDDFVKGKMFDWVTKNGGTIKEKGKDTDIFVFKLPNSKETFEISRFRYENNAIKQKNVATPAYNYPVRQFSQWLIKNHYVIIENRIKQETEKLGEKTKLLSSQIKKLNDEIRIGKDELNNMMTVNSDKDLMSGIKKYILRRDMDDNVEPVGVYAALKGYDAIIKERPGGCDNSYCIILNRSKVIVKK